MDRDKLGPIEDLREEWTDNLRKGLVDCGFTSVKLEGKDETFSGDDKHFAYNFVLLFPLKYNAFIKSAGYHRTSEGVLLNVTYT